MIPRQFAYVALVAALAGCNNPGNTVPTTAASVTEAKTPPARTAGDTSAPLTWEKVAGPQTKATAAALTPAGPRPPEAPNPVTRAQPVTKPPEAGPRASQTAAGNVTVTTTLSNPNLLMPGNGKVHLSIDLEALKQATGNRLPMNIALVIDRSGSMRGDKIEQTRAAARHLVSQLSDKDTLSIVSYSDDVRVDLPASRIDSTVKQQALDAIQRIRAGGSTNLSGGLFRGQDEVNRNLAQNQVNRVILMSDGLANRGITDTKQLSSKAQQHAQNGISVTTMGVGTDYNEDLMTAVADHASGNYYFIQESAQIASVFTQELNKMFSTVAQNVTVELLIEDGVELEQVHGYTFTRKADVVTIPLAELFAGQRRSILIGLKAPVLREGMARLAEVTLRYTDVASEGEARKAALAQSVRVTTNKERVEKTRNNTVEERVGEVEVATAMNSAAEQLRLGNGGEAQNILRGALMANEGRIGGLGGSARLKRQSSSLRTLADTFEEAEAKPAAAAATIKATKAKGRTLAR
ncbi:MAG: Ca-activated chloride channel family protein [Myxococcota bacterium]|jgi:Ca-activated chloride channel family protein